MSTTIHNHNVLGKLGSLVMPREIQADEAQSGGLRRWFKSWQARRAVAAELYAMTDRDLNDIGLARADIPMIVRTVK
ncbi:DUF1127 domain-containing protein [Acidocella aminolytica]|jgi:uncharacterized protein YjiS (DUF1127 family)|uniref:YjiS-like domain-containing protein n=1 Tax=Acidocella aminolytica 101 = DSM 11237 TaxID=1120923 RepID=A0A0D6PGL2_9PROT|nr:DUF1127 domain-containing protein [Acidocella aminolytica]GAN80516.1 hypothetical protein Aam_049_018 [Acidocella aminolytica 101 = DSM 11237]GBQ37807.1 hypothetical protein AA11237_1645 [Acidocella aminolytica 101 = DSM 11237]SHF39730.1 protein of unknown function [Acidocella aminolytica 101 = DSM 11237]